MQFDHYAIRPLSLNDLEPFYKMVDRNRSRLESFFTGTASKTKTLADTRLFINDMIKRASEKTYFPFIIWDTTSNTMVGFLDLKNIDWSIPKSEMGCYVDADYAGKGVTTKAFRIFCDYCFDTYHFEKLFLRTHHRNLAARRIAENCGFEIEGTLRKDYKTTSGELVDLIYYGRLKQ